MEPSHFSTAVVGLSSYIFYGCFRFLKKLLTEDLPRLFVRPKKIVLDFQKGKTVGPIPSDPKSGQSEQPKAGEMQEGNKDYAGELSVTLVDARKLSYIIYGMNLFIFHQWHQSFS